MQTGLFNALGFDTPHINHSGINKLINEKRNSNFATKLKKKILF